VCVCVCVCVCVVRDYLLQMRKDVVANLID
jgi:hypothetical protein